MLDVRPKAEEVDIVDAVLSAGLEAMRRQVAEGFPVPLNLPPLASGWRETTRVVAEFRAALRSEEGATVHLPRRRKATSGEGTVR